MLAKSKAYVREVNGQYFVYSDKDSSAPVLGPFDDEAMADDRARRWTAVGKQSTSSEDVDAKSLGRSMAKAGCAKREGTPSDWGDGWDQGSAELAQEQTLKRMNGTV